LILELPAAIHAEHDAVSPGHAAAQWRLGNLLEKKKDIPGARAGLRSLAQARSQFHRAADALKKLK